MKLGYPCINTTLDCSASKTFRLKSYTPSKLVEIVEENLSCLIKILQYNVANNLFFFRISSQVIPFASHDICQFNWQEHFDEKLTDIGKYIKENDIRISMHPGQFTLLNSPRQSIVEQSIRELDWHCRFLEALNLNEEAKVQIHVGGVYGDKEKAKNNFMINYISLPEHIKRRLVIENDDYSYSLQDCLEISKKGNIPVIFDTLHHECLNNGEPMFVALQLAQATWNESDGVLMVDYSSQEPLGRKGEHAKTINLTHFSQFIMETGEYDFDIMLEIKDKEKSALKAASYLSEDRIYL